MIVEVKLLWADSFCHTCLLYIAVIIFFPDWRSERAIWIIHGDYAIAETKIESIRCFARNWNR